MNVAAINKKNRARVNTDNICGKALIFGRKIELETCSASLRGSLSLVRTVKFSVLSQLSVAVFLQNFSCLLIEL